MLNSVSRYRLPLAAAAACAALVLGGCSADDAPTAGDAPTAPESSSQESTVSAQADFSACQPPTGPMAEAARESESEPAVEVPLPAGWTENTVVENTDERVIAANPSLMQDSFAANYTASVTEREGDDQRAAIDEEVGALGMIAMGEISDREPAEVCGFTAERMNIAYPAQAGAPIRQGSALVVAVPHDGATWAVTVSVQTTDPGQGSYQSDVDTIFAQLQVGV